MASLAIKDVCSRYDVHEQTVLQWIHSGELKAVNVGREPGKKKPRWRITEESLRAFEEKRANTTPATSVPRKRKRSGSDSIPDYVK